MRTLNRLLGLLRSRDFLLIMSIVLGFGLGFMLELVLEKLRVERATRITYILMGTIKNSSLAAATAMALFGERAAVPAAVISATNVIYLVWLGIHWGKE